MRLRAALAAALTTLAALAACAGGGEPPSPWDPELARVTAPAPPTGPVVLRLVDGSGLARRFPASFPDDPGFFPIAVWAESVTDPGDTAKDRAAGLNTYVELVPGSRPDLVREAGMYAVHGLPGAAGTETRGRVLADEPDMWAGPGDAPWTGRFPGESEDLCVPRTARCGYTVQREIAATLPDDGRLPRYANYGKGVLFWETDEEAARFVNEFQDIVSADAYWFTDRNVCGATEGGARVAGTPRDLTAAECHRASNYGAMVERLRHLVAPAGSRPVWGFVEVGHPATNDAWPSIRPQEITAAVWSQIVHGARGIVYFNHSFGGPCPTQHALREPCYADARAAVAALNERLTRLAPVLNAPTAEGVLATGDRIDAMVKYHDGHLYVFAANAVTDRQAAAFALRCARGTSAEVLDEGRTTPLAHGTLKDVFADDNAVHVYRVRADPACGLDRMAPRAP